jgi:hypothetical protein
MSGAVQTSARYRISWKPYLLKPSSPETGHDAYELLEIRNWDAVTRDGAQPNIVGRWPLDQALTNLWAEVFEWHERAEWSAAAAPRGRLITHDEVRAWLNETRSLSDRLADSLPAVAGRALADEMQALSRAIERVTEWSDDLENAPPFGTRKHARFECNVRLWALDQLARGINNWGQDSIALGRFWSHLFGKKAERARRPVKYTPFCDYLEAEKRIRRVIKSIRPGHEVDLMARVLRATLLLGPFGPDLAPRFRAHTSA